MPASRPGRVCISSPEAGYPRRNQAILEFSPVLGRLKPECTEHGSARPDQCRASRGLEEACFVMLKLAIVLASTAFSSNLLACRGPQLEDYVLLDALPNAAHEQAVVAKVQVVSRQDQAATVVVVEAIKGVFLEEKIELKTGGSSCSWLEAGSRFFNRQGTAAGKATPPNSYYIAGSWLSTPQQGDTRTFTGAWRGQARVR